MAVAGVRLKKWTRAQWHRLIDRGVLGEDDRVELLDGDIVEMTPQSELHAATVHIVSDALRQAFGAGFAVRVQSPVALDDRSEPEPDVSVVRGSQRDFRSERPHAPDLIVEVALSSLETDRDRKSSLYARAGRPEYWIVNLDEMVVEVYRNPVRDGIGFYDGWSYGTVQTLHEGDHVSLLAVPGASVRVADLLP
ncbi:MAG: Uma2 family endonuclease [Candidatus Sericytochromatia bacterium]|nr:Uma2 family endonuclease [Candidatus Tanganyikabacteria bacterium]